MKITTKSEFNAEEMLCPFCKTNNPECVLRRKSYDDLGYAILEKECEKIQESFTAWDTYVMAVNYYTCPNHKGPFTENEDVKIKE